MKRYHPHGDASIYPTLVRMAQDWNMRHRLIHSQGNFGSIAGLPPAAHRYTEARLTAIGGEMLADLECDTVDYIDNYDGKYREPLVLPSQFPNLLVNGSDGIAVGMATDIPPHNLREVCDALIRVIDNPAITIPQLMTDDEEAGFKGLQGPISPPAASSAAGRASSTATSTGRGKVTLRARADIVEEGRDTMIIIKEIPYPADAQPPGRGHRQPGQGRAHQGHPRDPRRVQRAQRRAGAPGHLSQAARPTRT